MKKIILLVIVCFSIILFSCTQEGIGGTSSISGNVKHHSEPISNAMVFIKYGANELPGTSASDYDDQTMTSSTDGSFRFDGLEKGSYYLYSMGYDSLIFDSVFGGLHIKLKNGEDFETGIPVTE